MQGQALLEVRNIKKSFSGVTVLSGIDVAFHKGECHALCGENGAGKSTLMKILAGAYTRDSGEVLLEGKPFQANSPQDAREKGISIIYQELSLIPTLSAGENVFLGRLPRKMGRVDWEKVYAETKKCFKMLDLAVDPMITVSELSVAHRQMVEISRALTVETKVVIMDEPTSSMSDKEIVKLYDIINKFKARGIAVIYISHKLEEIFAICDRVTVLKDGQITGTKRTEDTDKEELVSMMVGRTLEQYYPKLTNVVHDEILFEAKNISDGKLVKDVSFHVKKGEILGFSGLVGAGRTETMRAIFSADKLREGSLFMHGNEIKFKSPAGAIKNQIAFATEDRRNEGLVMTMSIRENTTLASYKTISNSGGIINEYAETEIAQSYIDKMSTKATGMEQRVVQLSGGNQQKVVISKWLNTGADVFIFDEPTRGIDVGAKAEIYQLIVDLASQGKGIIVVSSELPEILGLCNRICVMHDGKIEGVIDRKDATEESIMALAVGGV